MYGVPGSRSRIAAPSTSALVGISAVTGGVHGPGQPTPDSRGGERRRGGRRAHHGARRHADPGRCPGRCGPVHCGRTGSDVVGSICRVADCANTDERN